MCARTNIGASDGNYNNLENTPVYQKDEISSTFTYPSSIGSFSAPTGNNFTKFEQPTKVVSAMKDMTKKLCFNGTQWGNAIFSTGYLSLPETKISINGESCYAYGNAALYDAQYADTGESYCFLSGSEHMLSFSSNYSSFGMSYSIATTIIK